MSFASARAAHDALVAALEAASASLSAAERFEVVQELAETLKPPSALLAPPLLTWAGPGPEPSDATFVVVAVVAASERAQEQLFSLVASAAEAIDQETDLVMRQAEPGTWPTGDSTLPCYTLTVEVAL
jgi:hypothetical protein